MKNIFYWKRFEKTGNIEDYLSYTACTSEESNPEKRDTVKEGGQSDSTGVAYRDGIDGSPCWRV